MERQSAVRNVLVVAAVALLVACANRAPWQDVRRVDAAEEVGHVYVSAYPAVSWDDIGDKLEPKHNLSTADARAMAVVTTQSQFGQTLSSFSAGLGLGLPARSKSDSRAVDSNGVVTTSSASQSGPGAVPASSGMVSTIPATGEIQADLSKAGLTSGVDASTQLMVGTAVYQLAAILDNQLSKGWKLKGYQASLITFQINLQPGPRDLGYDTYVNLTLLPGEWRKSVATSSGVNERASAFSPVVVYPLVIADAAESSSVAMSAEVVRQAALSLSGVVNNIGANAGLGAVSDKLDAILASDRNSLTTVGRISDHALRIRIGAQLQGSKKLAMVPKTQNISVVVFTRADVERDRFLDRLAVVSEVSFADVETGKILPAKTESQRLLDAQLPVRALMRRHDMHFSSAKACGGAAIAPTNVLRALDRGDYEFLNDCLAVGDPASRGNLPFDAPDDDRMLSTYADTPGAAVRQYGVLKDLLCQEEWNDWLDALARADTRTAQPSRTPDNNVPSVADKHRSQPTCSNPRFSGALGDGLTPAVETEMRMLFAEMMGLQADARFSKLTVALRFKPSAGELPTDQQIVMLKDDGKRGQVVVRGGADLVKDKIDARLIISNKQGKRYLLPEALEVQEGKVVSLAFPSLSGNKLTADIDDVHPAPAAKGVVKVARGKPAPVADAAPVLLQLQLRYGKLDAPGLQDRVYAITPVAGQPAEDSNPLRVSSAALIADQGGQAKLTITVGKADATAVPGFRISGAEVRSTEPKLVFKAAANLYVLPAESQVVVTLGNLTPAKTVQLLGFAGDKAVGTAISLPVQTNRYKTE
nr:hypothetical protein [uncultured Duganella sp.]